MDDRRERQLREFDQALHELCQPLTALQCVLELGKMVGDPKSLQEAVDSGLTETERMFASVIRMRAWLRAQDAAADDGSSVQ